MNMWLGFRTLGKRISSIRFMMADKKVAKWKKLIIGFGIVYVIFPIEILPDFLFPIGFIDDLVLWGIILYYLKETLDEYWIGGKKDDFSKKYKNTIDDVEYEVKTDSKEDDKGE